MLCFSFIDSKILYLKIDLSSYKKLYVRSFVFSCFLEYLCIFFLLYKVLKYNYQTFIGLLSCASIQTY